MATISNVTTEIRNTIQDGITLHCLWEALVTGSLDGDAFINPNFKDICVQVKGTFDTATLTMQGTNDKGDAGTETWFTLTDGVGIAAGNNVVFTAAGAKQIYEAPYKIRPLVSSVGATTDLDVTLVASTTARR
jgi:hypothetical protein